MEEVYSFDNQSFVGSILSFRCFRKMSFVNCNLGNVYFLGCDLRSCNFSNSTLVNTRFINANLLQANFVKRDQANSLFPHLLSLAPDGSVYAIGFPGNGIEIFDLKSNQSICRLKDHIKPVTVVEFSDDSKFLASGSSDSTINVYKRNKHSKVICFDKHTHNVFSLCFIPQKGAVASHSAIGRTLIWEIDTGNVLYDATRDLAVCLLKFSPLGNYLSYVQSFGIKLVDYQTMQTVREFNGNSYHRYSMVYSNNEQFLGYVYQFKHVKLFSLQTMTEIKCMKFGVKSICSLAFSPDSSQLAIGYVDNSIKLVDLDTFSTLMFTSCFLLSTRLLLFLEEELISGCETFYSWRTNSLYK